MRSAYSPVRPAAAGGVSVELAADHPGVADPAYRARRDALAALATTWTPGEPLPEPVYTEVEDDVWATVSAELRVRHGRHATRRFLDAVGRLDLPTDRVPQLREVNERLRPLTGFRYQPVAGLAPLRHFYGDFADGIFWSTQYLRHPSVPLYTPEPDIVHEVIGHGTHLADPELADLYRLVGAAVARCEGDHALRVLSTIFWFTVEFGVVVEGGHHRAFGAGLLSSVGELDAYTDATIVPADLTAMATVDYDITRYQPVLFAYPSELALVDSLADLLRTFDDDDAARLTARTTPATVDAAGVV